MKLIAVFLISLGLFAVVPPTGLAGASKVAPKKLFQGVIDEVIKREQFVYVRLGSDWFALVETPLSVGQKVKIDVQVAMDNFHSKQLNRTFSKLNFGKLVP